MQSTLNEPKSEAWRQIAPLLDDALARLGEKDRNAVVLRFFENKNLQEVGLALGANEDAAKMRVNRALDKLRKLFAKRGVSSTTAILAGAISANAVQGAPVALAKSVTAVAMAKGATASISTLTLIKGALKIMAWTKVKTLVTGATAIICIATTTTLVVNHQPHLPKPQPVISTETDFPKSSWAFAGYGDPQSALVSLLWAETKFDRRTFLASLTPEGKQKQEQQFKDTMNETGKSKAEVFAEAARRLDKMPGFQIRGQESISENEVLLHLYIQGNEIRTDAKMVKIGNEWKLDDFLDPKPLPPNAQH
jgi:hypothetical protein